jgi:hypothetical protein
MSQRVLLAVIAVAIVAVIAAAFAAGRAGLLPSGDIANVIYLLLWLILIVGSGAYVGRARLGAWPAALRNAAIWLAILLAAMGAYVLFIARA